MKLYNVSIDETEEVSLAFYLKHRFFKFLRVDAPIALTYSVILPAKAICKKCIEDLACKIYDKRRGGSPSFSWKNSNIRFNEFQKRNSEFMNSFIVHEAQKRGYSPYSNEKEQTNG